MPVAKLEKFRNDVRQFLEMGAKIQAIDFRISNAI